MNVRHLKAWLATLPPDMDEFEVCSCLAGGMPSTAKRVVAYRYARENGGAIVINPMGTHLQDSFYDTTERVSTMGCDGRITLGKPEERGSAQSRAQTVEERILALRRYGAEMDAQHGMARIWFKKDGKERSLQIGVTAWEGDAEMKETLERIHPGAEYLRFTFESEAVRTGSIRWLQEGAAER